MKGKVLGGFLFRFSGFFSWAFLGFQLLFLGDCINFFLLKILITFF